MRFPQRRFAVLGVAVLLDVILLVALTTVLLYQRRQTTDRHPQSVVPAKVEPTKVEPEESRRLARYSFTLRFRVVDAVDRKPIGLARIVIDNVNLAPELGDDSDAVTWPDGRAIITHRFLVWEERRENRWFPKPIFQGPWIHVFADGHPTRKMPLSDVLGPSESDSGLPNETIITLQPGRAGGSDLAGLAGNYIFGDGFVYEQLQNDPGPGESC